MFLRAIFLVALFALMPRATLAEPITFVVNESAFNNFTSAVGNKTGVLQSIRIDSKPVRCPTFEDPDKQCTETLFTAQISWELSGVQFSLKQQEDITLQGTLKGTFSGRDKLGVPVEVQASADVSASGSMEYDAANSQIRINVASLSASLTFGLPNFGNWTSPPIALPTPDYGFAIPLAVIILRVATPSAGSVPVHLKPRKVEFEVQDGSVRIRVDLNIW